MSIMTKLKSMPTSYWVVGLGAAALGVDYLIEGEGSIVSSIWRGVTGGGRGAADGEAPAPPARHAAAPHAPPGPVLAQPGIMLPSFEYQVMPYGAPHRHRRYYPAHEPFHVRERHFREWPRRGFLPPHDGRAEHRVHPGHAERGPHAGHFDWER